MPAILNGMRVMILACNADSFAFHHQLAMHVKESTLAMYEYTITLHGHGHGHAMRVYPMQQVAGL